MAQTFAPGTILAIGSGETLEEVVMLTDNKVATRTFAGKRVTRRDYMSFADWIILSDGQEIRRSDPAMAAPLAPAVPAVAAPAVPAVAAPVAKPVEENYPANTLLRWKKDEQNKRVALVLKDGILQVKEVIMGLTTFDNLRRCKQMFFSSLADWKATLPAGGQLTSEAGVDHSVPSIKRKATEPIKAATDVEYINTLKNRFYIRSGLIEIHSQVEKRDENIKYIKANMAIMQEQIAKLSTVSVRDAHTTFYRMQTFNKLIRNQTKAALYANTQIIHDPKNANVRRMHFENNYKQVLYGYIGDNKVEMTANKNAIGLAWDKQKNYFGRWVTPTVVTNFAEAAALGLKMKADGKPFLTVAYRGKQIDI